MEHDPTFQTPGHMFCGYKGHGVYRCECGWEIKCGDSAISYIGPTAVTSINDQWRAHKREAIDGSR